MHKRFYNAQFYLTQKAIHATASFYFNFIIYMKKYVLVLLFIATHVLEAMEIEIA